MPSTITLAPTPAATLPGSSNIAGATQASSAPGGSGVAPLTSAPAGNIPVTTIQIQQTVTVPCTYTNGASAGSTIPSSSTTTVVSSAITVPQVQFVTQAAAGSTSAVGLAAGSPSSVPASATEVAVGASGVNAPTTFASAYAQGNATATSTVVPFLGAGNAVSPSVMITAVIGGILVLFTQL
ncbi:MAG: hypothetical protein M1830_002212 [Pleopsidium flavum]|nr:MAG: hypothetical protein M1830_002212 [Pleopsidium flavum]